MNKSSPYAVKVKIVRENGRHCVKEVWGDGWKTMAECQTREKALMIIDWLLRDKLAQWAREVKMRAHWTCEDCGELDQSMLEAHHIKPRDKYPELMYEPSNGRCLCTWCHAFKHTGITRDHILARLAIKLYRRIYPEKFKEEKADRPAEEVCGYIGVDEATGPDQGVLFSGIQVQG